MKIHYNGDVLSSKATVGQHLSEDAVCGSPGTAVTSNWDRVDCKLCLAYRPDPSLSVGMGVRHRDGRLGIITEEPRRGGSFWSVMFLGFSGPRLIPRDELAQVELTVNNALPSS